MKGSAYPDLTVVCWWSLPCIACLASGASAAGLLTSFRLDPFIRLTPLPASSAGGHNHSMISVPIVRWCDPAATVASKQAHAGEAKGCQGGGGGANR